MAWRTLLLALAYAAYAKREGEESSLVQASDNWAVYLKTLVMYAVNN